MENKKQKNNQLIINQKNTSKCGKNVDKAQKTAFPSKKQKVFAHFPLSNKQQDLFF